ncbi:hypothetical protein D3C86_1808230 [compost metagenome]
MPFEVADPLQTQRLQFIDQGADAGPRVPRIVGVGTYGERRAMGNQLGQQGA